MSSNVYVYDFIRSPIGRHGGILASVRPDDLLSSTILKLPKLKNFIIEEIITGCSNQAGEDNRNIARMVSLLSGVDCPAVTVNRLCASGLQAVADGFNRIRLGIQESVIASGVESMSRAPYVMAKPDKAYKFGNPEVFDTTLGWRFTNPKLAQKYYPYSMGETAENLVEKFSISREEQDAFAYQSHQNYFKNINWIKKEICEIETPTGAVNSDEHPRSDISLEKLSTLKPAFKKNGSVTPGNSSGINDGAAALILSTKKTDMKPLAEIIDWASAAVDPAIMGIGPVDAIQKLLSRNNLKLSEVSFIEINEAFAVQVLACCKLLGIDSKQVNRFGGAVAMGHPLGMSGARLVGRASLWLHENPGQYAIVSLCVGVGQGMAMLLKSAH